MDLSKFWTICQILNESVKICQYWKVYENNCDLKSKFRQISRSGYNLGVNFGSASNRRRQEQEPDSDIVEARAVSDRLVINIRRRIVWRRKSGAVVLHQTETNVRASNYGTTDRHTSPDSTHPTKPSNVSVLLDTNAIGSYSLVAASININQTSLDRPLKVI